jgi:hypothetical protein
MTRNVLAFPKPVRFEDDAYLRFIRRQPCLICGAASQAHHVQAGGVGTKCSDYRTVPLCHNHHRELHNHGRTSFELQYSVDLNLEQIRFLEIYLSALNDGDDLGAR